MVMVRMYLMIDLNKHFNMSELSDVAYYALIVLADDNQEIDYLRDTYNDLIQHKHWLVQLNYCFNKLDNKNFFLLCNKLNYDPSALYQSFRVINRK